jgi:hypothetical protein
LWRCGRSAGAVKQAAKELGSDPAATRPSTAVDSFSLLVPFAASPQNAHRHHRGRRPRSGSISYFGPVILSGGLLVVDVVQGSELAQALLMSGVALLITSLEGWLLTRRSWAKLRT